MKSYCGVSIVFIVFFLILLCVNLSFPLYTGSHVDATLKLGPIIEIGSFPPISLLGHVYVCSIFSHHCAIPLAPPKHLPPNVGLCVSVGFGIWFLPPYTNGMIFHLWPVRVNYQTNNFVFFLKIHSSTISTKKRDIRNVLFFFMVPLANPNRGPCRGWGNEFVEGVLRSRGYAQNKVPSCLVFH